MKNRLTDLTALFLVSFCGWGRILSQRLMRLRRRTHGIGFPASTYSFANLSYYGEGGILSRRLMRLWRRTHGIGFLANFFLLRKGWDSNPRRTCALTGFQDQRFRPLSHPSYNFSPSANGILSQRLMRLWRRTHGGLAPSTVFKTARFNRSRTSPILFFLRKNNSFVPRPSINT